MPEYDYDQSSSKFLQSGKRSDKSVSPVLPTLIVISVLLAAILGFVVFRILAEPNIPVSELFTFGQSTTTTSGPEATLLDNYVYKHSEVISDNILTFQINLYTYAPKSEFEPYDFNPSRPLPDHYRNAWSRGSTNLHRTTETVHIPNGFSQFNIGSSDDSFEVWGKYTLSEDSEEGYVVIDDRFLEAKDSGSRVLRVSGGNFQGTLTSASPLGVNYQWHMGLSSSEMLVHIPWIDSFKIMRFLLPEKGDSLWDIG